MNSFRVKFKDAGNKQLLVQSTLDKSYFLNPREDEEVQFDRNALVILKNMAMDTPVVLKIQCGKVDRPGAGIIFRSTRRSTFIITAGDSIKIKMQGGETFQIRGEDAVDKRDCAPVAGVSAV